MDEKEQMRKLLNLAESTGTRKQPKDLYNVILSRLTRNKSQDVRIEYFESLEDMRQIKSAVEILKNNNNMVIEEKNRIDKLISDINSMYERRLLSPESKIDSSNSKYNFREGSSSRFEDYNNIKEAILEADLINKITEISNLCSEGLGIIGVNKNTFWQKEDMIEEIDPSKVLREINNG